MPTNRCRHIVFDPLTRKNRLCKNKKFFFDYCKCHLNLVFYKNATLIQSCYKGYYVRQKLKRFYNLPRDLQRKIIWHMNKDIYLRHFNCSLWKIIKYRYDEFFNNQRNKIIINLNQYNLTHNSYIFMNENMDLFFIDFAQIINLTIKYKSIIVESEIQEYIQSISSFIINNKLHYKKVLNNDSFYINLKDYIISFSPRYSIYF